MITIYGKPGCGYCDKAKKICLDNDIKFVYIDISEDKAKAELLNKLPGAKTVPQIFIGDVHIGGYGAFMVELQHATEEQLCLLKNKD